MAVFFLQNVSGRFAPWEPPHYEIFENNSFHKWNNVNIRFSYEFVVNIPEFVHKFSESKFVAEFPKNSRKY